MWYRDNVSCLYERQLAISAVELQGSESRFAESRKIRVPPRFVSRTIRRCRPKFAGRSKLAPALKTAGTKKYNDSDR